MILRHCKIVILAEFYGKTIKINAQANDTTDKGSRCHLFQVEKLVINVAI
jgi:hypothetical protein